MIFHFSFRALFATCLIVAASFILYGCGGGGGSSTVAVAKESRLDPSAAQKLTGAQPPAETSGDILAREPGIIARTDGLIASTLYGDLNTPGYTQVAVRASCSGRRCTYSVGGDNFPIDLENLHPDPNEAHRPVLTKYGITILEQTGRIGYTNYHIFGGWLDHSVFLLETGTYRVPVDNRNATYRLGGAAGDLTGTRPGGTAKWQGLMAGTPQFGPNKGDLLQGDASLTYNMASGTLAATFTGIKNLDRNIAYSVIGLRFDDVPVSTNGTYSAGTAGNLIRGGFAGPAHAETAGIVEQRGIVGAFGASKTEE